MIDHMHILLTDQDDYIYGYDNNNNIKIVSLHISEINLKKHNNSLNFNFHLEYIDPKERIIKLDNLHSKLCNTNRLVSMSDILALLSGVNIYEKKERLIYYFRIVISRDKHNYVLSDRYTIFSMSTIKKFNLNVSPVYIEYLCCNNKIDILEYLQRNNRLESIKGYIQNDNTLVDKISEKKTD